MKQIGVTGTIGSGKSFICSIFSDCFGIPVFDSDSEAKACYSDDRIKEAVRRNFGERICPPDGEVDLRLLSQTVFSDPAALERLNGIVHPAVIERYRKWLLQQEGVPYTLFESAIIYSCHLEKMFDAVIRVRCPETLAIARVKARNGWDEETIRSRLRLQEDGVGREAGFLILHDSRLPLEESRRKLLPQIQEIHRRIISTV